MDWSFLKGKEIFSSAQHAKYLKDSQSRTIHEIKILCNGELQNLSREYCLEKFGVEYLNQILFEKEQYLIKSLKETDRRLRNPNNKKMDRWASALFKKEFNSIRIPQLLIKKIDPLIGYGIFSLKNISQYTYIGEYTGVIRKRKSRLDKFNDYIFGYIACNSPTPYVVDASKKGNFTRFLNHSDDPNLTSRWIVVDGICHIVFFTNRLVKKGEQLTYDYGKYYWKKRSAPLSNL